jgi:hypothetical protein
MMEEAARHKGFPKKEREGVRRLRMTCRTEISL